MSKKDYYSILEIDKNASQEEIKKQYKKLAFKYHPDRNKDDKNAEEKFKEIGEAYSVLSNPDKRNEYDNPEQFQHNMSGHFGGDFMRDFLRNHFGGMSEEGQDFFQQSRNSMSINGVLKQNFKTIINGYKGEIDITYFKHCNDCVGQKIDTKQPSTSCSTCNGQGGFTQQKGPFTMKQMCGTCMGTGKTFPPCAKCNGTGGSNEKGKLNIEVPPGYLSGLLKVPSKEYNKVFIVKIATDLPLDKEIDDMGNVKIEHAVPFTVLCTGGKITIQDLEENNVTVKIPEKTKSKTIIRLTGKGIPNSPESKTRGNLLIEVYPIIPNTFTKEQQKLLEELQKTGL